MPRKSETGALHLVKNGRFDPLQESTVRLDIPEVLCWLWKMLIYSIFRCAVSPASLNAGITKTLGFVGIGIKIIAIHFV